MVAERAGLQISPAVLFAIAAAIILFPVQWLIAWITASAFHELCHLLVLKLFRIPIYEIRLTLCGARILTADIQKPVLGICAVAGPLGSLFLLVFSKYIPRTAVCAFIQSVFNLLPILPFDGGRALLGFLCIFLGERKAQRICDRAGALLLVLLLGACLFICFRFSYYAIMIIPCMVILSARKGKIACNRGF